MGKKVYVIRPDMECYYGIEINKDTKIVFENEYVKQKIENLTLESVTNYKCEEYESETKLKMKLKEGDILLLEEDKRGYFMPRDINIGSIDDAFADLEFLKEQISKIKE